MYLHPLHNLSTPIEEEQTNPPPYYNPSTDDHLNIHKYELTTEEIKKIFNRDIYSRVINSKPFQRLKNIHFLGAIDYIIDPNGPKPNNRHNRFQHSIGVARLALSYSKKKLLTDKEETICVLSALLHDIGHAPLSHSLESVFKEKFNINHHLASEQIIKGEVELGYDLIKIFKEFDINLFSILETISGYGKYKEIFGFAINIDTIEGILRSSTYLHEAFYLPSPGNILDCLLNLDENSTKTLDSFWLLKNEIYGKLINNREGVLADFISQQYMKQNSYKFYHDYYFYSEKKLQKEHHSLFNSLKELSAHSNKNIPDKIEFFNRKFQINKIVLLNNIRDLNLRYTQSKSLNKFSYSKGRKIEPSLSCHNPSQYILI